MLIGAKMSKKKEIVVKWLFFSKNIWLFVVNLLPLQQKTKISVL